MILLWLSAVAALANDGPPPAEVAEVRAQVVRQALAEVAASVVQIETIGGDERVEGRRTAVGPTTGVIVREDGLVVTSTFNFVHRPSTILVTLPDGKRLAARRVANDQSRMLTLLKVEAGTALRAAQPAPLAEVRVGQTAIAVGRPFESAQVVQAHGIISALGRVSGKALQTDARVSPHHYGGPLVDLWGRTLGIVVPLSPMESGAMAGADWYDSGIGFAIPLEHVLAVLPRWAEGRDLTPGVAGVRLASRDPLETPAKLADVRPGSPAFRAGLRTGDVALSVDGEATHRVGQFQAALARRYAGETVTIIARRDQAELSAAVELAETVPAYRHPRLGILPAWEPQESGVQVAELLPGEAAEAAGLLPGDVIVAVDGQDIADRTALEAALAEHVAGDRCLVAWRRGAETGQAEVALADAALTMPPDAAPRRELATLAAAASGLPSGKLKTGPGGAADRYALYVPESFAPAAGFGLVALLTAVPLDLEAAAVGPWLELCRTQRLALLLAAPQSKEAWRPGDVASLKETIADLQQRYGLLGARTALVADGKAAPAAAALVEAGSMVRGLAVVGAAPLALRRENEPSARRWLHTIRTPDVDAVKFREAMQSQTRLGYWATSGEAAAADLSAEDVRLQLGRWLSGLDRL